eukprot:ctg_1175.g377
MATERRQSARASTVHAAAGPLPQRGAPGASLHPGGDGDGHSAHAARGAAIFGGGNADAATRAAGATAPGQHFLRGRRLGHRAGQTAVVRARRA